MKQVAAAAFGSWVLVVIAASAFGQTALPKSRATGATGAPSGATAAESKAGTTTPANAAAAKPLRTTPATPTAAPKPVTIPNAVREESPPPPTATAESSLRNSGAGLVAVNAVDPTSNVPPSLATRTAPEREAADTWYIFFGARYRGNLLPQFLLNLAVSEGTTVYSSSLGIEAEFRKNGFSIIPALTFTEFGMDETLFLEKGKPEVIAGNWSRISSSLKGLYGSADFLWSKKLNRNLDLEYGFGLGLGATFGELGVNWVYEDPKGAYRSSAGRTFSPCQAGDEIRADRIGCSTRDHSFAKTARVGNYSEASWFNGGAKPSFLPQVSVPIGLRFKPSEAFAGRFQLGLSLTGFWFGISGGYGLPGRKSNPRANPGGEAVEVEETVE
jgi:hypothetical protein